MLSYITSGKYAESLSDETARAFERLWTGKADEGVLKENGSGQKTLMEMSPEKQELIQRLSDKSLYQQDQEEKHLYIHPERIALARKNKREQAVHAKETDMARRLANHYGVDVFLLPPDVSEGNMLVLKGKNPDGIVNGVFFDEKQPQGKSESSIQKNFRKAVKQADLMYLDLTESGLSLDEAVQRISDQVAMDATNYDGFCLVVVDGNGRFSEFQINKKELVESSFLGGPGLSSRTQSPGDGIPLGNSTIASKPNSVKGTPFELAEDTPSMAEVRRKYEGTDQWMKAPGGELVAVHLMGSEYLDKAIKEGLPMPSIAITKHDNTELHYGEVAFIGGRTLAQRLLVDGHIYNDDADTVPRPDSTNKQANPAQPMSAQQAFDLMAPEQNDLDRSLPPGVRRITSWDDLKQQGSHAHGYPAVQGEASTYQLRNRLWNLASEARALYYTGPGEGWVQSDGKFASVVNDLYAKRTMAPDKIRGAFASAGFKLPDSMVQEVARILEDFDNRQREYLEAKPFQILHVGDFEAVAVPTGKVDAQTLQALRDAGLQVIEYADTRNSDGTRNFAAGKAIDQWLKKNPGTLFELTDKETADIVRQVDSLTKQDIGKPHAVIDISSHTPFVFRELGLDDLKVVMYRGKLARGLYLPEGRRHGHSEGLDKGIVKKVLESFADPVYVFDSRTDVNSLVAVYDVLDKHDNPMMASVTIDKNASQVLVDLVTSIYGKTRRKYQSWVDSGLLRYADDMRKNLPDSARLQLPSKPEGSYRDNIIYKSQLVNKPGAFFELAEDEEVSPKTLFELTVEQRDGFVKKWRTDVERVVCDATQQNPDSRSDAVNAGMAYAIVWRAYACCYLQHMRYIRPIKD